MSIRDDFFAAQAKASLWDVAVSIKRGNPLPLDANAVYNTLGTAIVNGETTTYTAGSLLEYAKTNPVAYPGQVCAVVEETSTTIYYLDQNLDVRPVGVIPSGDNKTITVTADGAISLLGAAEAGNGTLPIIDNETGKLVWKTLEDIGAGDGNDNTTYEFTSILTDGNNPELYGFKVKPLFNGQPIKVTSGDGQQIDLIHEFAFDVYTKTQTDAAIDNAVKGILGEGVNEAYNTLKEIQDILEGTNGEAIDGLIETVADNRAKIETLNGDVNVTGSVDQKIATAIADENLGQYATKQEITDAGYAINSDVANTYATKQSIGEIPSDVKATTIVEYINEKAQKVLDSATGGSSETVASVKQQLDNYKTANNPKVNALLAEVYGALGENETEYDYSADSRIDSLEKVTTDQGATISNINSNVSKNTTDIGTINTTINTDINPRLTSLEGADQTIQQSVSKNTEDISTLNNSTIPALQGKIDSKLNSTDFDTFKTTVIGTVPSDKTVVQMIADAQSAATYDDTAVKNSIAAIYHKEGTDSATGVLAEEIARATAAEQANANAITALAGEGNTSTVKKNADDIAALANGAVKANTEAIAVINGADTGKSMRTVAHEEALKVETAAMEFMGTVTELPTLTEADKGHFYKVAAEIETGNTVTEINSTQNFYVDESGTDIRVLYFGANGQVSPDNREGWFYTDSYNSTGSIIHGRIAPVFVCNKAIKVECLYQYTDRQGEEDIVSDIYTTTDYFEYSRSSDTQYFYCFKVTLLGDIDYDTPSSGTEPCTLLSIIDAKVVPTDAQTIKIGDSIVWSGSVWYVIPSGDDSWRPIIAKDVTISNTAPLTLIEGNNIVITPQVNGNVRFDVPFATLHQDSALVSLSGSIKPVEKKFEVEAGKVTKISTDLLISGENELIFDCGNARTGITT